MRKWYHVSLSGWLVVAAFLLIFSPVKVKNFTPTAEYRQVVEQNRVALTCMGDNNDAIDGGQGTVINVDQTGTWIITAGHVVATTPNCIAEFNNKGIHAAYRSFISKKSDIAILFVPRFQWLTQASMAPLKLDEDIADFGPVLPDYRLTNGEDRQLGGFLFVLNDALYTGVSLTPAPGVLLYGVPVPKGNLFLTNIYSAPGSSGGGVYDKKGNLVGVVSLGSLADHYVTYIVNVEAALEGEDNE